MTTDNQGIMFGREIRRRREAMGLTLEEFAARSKLTPNYIGSVEIGKRDPSLSTVFAVAQGLNICPIDLFGTGDDLSPTALEAATLFDIATPEVQKAILQLLRVTARKSRSLERAS